MTTETQPVIQIARDYLLIQGTPRFIYGGDVNYCRMRRRWWRDRLQKLRAAGMNTIAFYGTWLYHEPEEARWTFDGDLDLGAFMDLCQQEGFFTIPRIGPFVHGEMRNGGLPQWLVDKLGNRVRTNDPDYLHYTGDWYDHVLPIIAPRLITRGGSAILIQMENELGSAGAKGDDVHRGSEDPEERGKHIRFYNAFLEKYGIDIPIIDINKPYPGKEELPLVDTGGGYPTNCFGCDGELADIQLDWWKQHTRPRVSIETMSGMFPRYYDWPPYQHTNGFQGPLVSPALIEAFSYQHLAEGYNGINYFVLNDSEFPEATAERMLPQRIYNFQAPLSVAGNLRDAYQALKRLGWFLRAFEAEVVTSQPHETWAKATSYGIPHPGVETVTNDLFEGYHREVAQTTEFPRQVRRVKAGGRVNKGLNLSESNFLFLVNTRNHGSTWARDIRMETCPAGIPCELSQEYPKRIQMELAPQENKIVPFFVRLAPRHFLEYATASPLDRRPFGDGVQLILHNRADATTEARFVLPERCPTATRNGSLIHWESPCTASVIGIAGPAMEIVTFATPTPMRYVLMNSERAGEVWDIASPLGSLVAASNLRVLDSSVVNGETQLALQANGREFYCYLLSPQRPMLRIAGVTVQEEYDAAFGLYRVGGTLSYSVPELPGKQRYQGATLIWEAPVSPDMLDASYDDLCLHVTYDGTLAAAYLDDVLISDHPFGRFTAWEIHLRDRLTRPGTLRLEMQETHAAQVAVQPVVNVAATLYWGSAC